MHDPKIKLPLSKNPNPYKSLKIQKKEAIISARKILIRIHFKQIPVFQKQKPVFFKNTFRNLY